jgi:transcriptional regulator with XRE-family HTH domain
MLAPIMADDIQEIGDRLRLARESKHLNQATWCKLVGIETQAWNNYERGRKRISIDQALKVCTFAGVTLDWIYRGVQSASIPLELAMEIQARGKRGRR